MSDLDFGLTMIVVGMGGTLLTLWLLTLFIDLLRKVWPVDNVDSTKPNP